MLDNVTAKDVIYLGLLVLMAIFQAIAGVVAFFSNKSNAANAAAIEKVAHETNSMKDELVKEVRISSLALGKKQEQDEQEKIKGVSEAVAVVEKTKVEIKEAVVEAVKGAKEDKKDA